MEIPAAGSTTSSDPDAAPVDLQDELQGGAGSSDGPTAPGSAPPPPEVGVSNRERVRLMWLGVGGMLEAGLGAPMHHSPADIETLVDCSLPLAEAFGFEWLGQWVLVAGFVGGVAAVEAPKLRALRAMAPAAPTVAEVEVELAEEFPVDGARTDAGPAEDPTS